MEHQALTPWDQRTTMSHRHEEGQHGRLGNRESKRMKKIPWRQWNNKAQQPSRDWECTRILDFLKRHALSKGDKRLHSHKGTKDTGTTKR